MLRELPLIASSPSFWRERTEVRVARDEFALTLALSRDGRGKSSVENFFRAQDT